MHLGDSCSPVGKTKNWTPFPGPLGFELSVTAIAATARANSLAASILLSSAFTGRWSLALWSGRSVKSHTLGVNLVPWAFASMLSTAALGLVPFTALSWAYLAWWMQLPGSAWEPLSKCTVSWKVAGFWVTWFTLFSWLSRKTSPSKTQRFGWFLAPPQTVAQLSLMVLGVSQRLHSHRSPSPDRLESLHACTSLGWAQQLHATLTCQGCPWQISSPIFIISREDCIVSWPGSTLHWKGASCWHLVKVSYFMHVFLSLKQSPSFSWDFKMPWVCVDYVCTRTAGSPKKHPGPGHHVHPVSKQPTAVLPQGAFARVSPCCTPGCCPCAVKLWYPTDAVTALCCSSAEWPARGVLWPEISATGVRSWPGFCGWLQQRQQSWRSL